MTIRFATAADAGTIHRAIVGIAEALGAADKVVSTPDDIVRHGFGDSPAFRALVAESDGIFAGLCLYFPSFSTWYGSAGVYVQDLYVEPAFRGHGVGERLMRRVASLSKRDGCSYIRLSVDSENTRAQDFYAKAGLTWSRAERIFAARGDAFFALAALDGDD